MNLRLTSFSLCVLAIAAACPEPEPCDDAVEDCGEGEGEGEPPPCVIGDDTAAAEIELVYRTVDGQIEKLDDGDEVPLILPVQGGKVIYVGVRGRNLSCRVNLTAGVFDLCQEPATVVGVDGRPVLLVDDGAGTAVPVNDPSDIVVGNLANVPMCPTFASTVDTNTAEMRLELRVTEERRAGEDESRVHTLTALIRPVCAEEAWAEDCNCECDAGFVLEMTREEQCPTIDDDDPPEGECPMLP